MEKELIKKIAHHHTMVADKFYRMFAGLSSDLDDYTDSTIFITIHKNRRWPKDNIVTAKQIAGDWRDFNDELKDAEKYHVTIIDNDAPTGFVLSKEDLDDKSKVRAVVNAIKDTMEKAALKDEPAGVVITGYFNDFTETKDKFKQLSDQQKLSLYHKMINSNVKGEFDDLLYQWWLSRY